MDETSDWDPDRPPGNWSDTNETSVINGTVVQQFPGLLYQQNVTVILVYSALFVAAAVGNLTVFISLFRSRHRKSRISLMIRHLAIADLIVTFIMIPIEVGWRLTGRWIAGNFACKVFQFLRAFGPYLSSNVLICVSLDRYFAVLHPLRVTDARRRGKVMLAFAWGASFCYCIPQSFVFRVMSHPQHPEYQQCVTFEYFPSPAMELVYNLSCVMFLYFIPLFVIIVAYTCISCEISRNSRITHGDSQRTSNGRLRLRRSDISNIERARSRTLRMTITIVCMFIVCCTPYVIITLWYMFDREGAENLPGWLQDTFFMMVVSNSCMNPLVYGSYVLDLNRINCSCFGCCRKDSAEVILNNADVQLATTGHRQFARRVIKCVLGLKKVNSATTRSTAMPASNLKTRDANLMIVPCKNGKAVLVQRPGSRSPISQRSVGSQSSGRCTSSRYSAAASFHSEPCQPTGSGHPMTVAVMRSNSIVCTTSDWSAVKIETSEGRVFYSTDRTKCRNV